MQRLVCRITTASLRIPAEIEEAIPVNHLINDDNFFCRDFYSENAVPVPGEGITMRQRLRRTLVLLVHYSAKPN